MKNFKALLALAFLAASCASEATIENGDIETLFHKERTLTLTAQKNISEALPPCEIAEIIGNYAILQIHDSSADFNFYIVDINSGEVVNKIFSIGKGRNEMMYPWYMCMLNGKFFIYDQVNKLLFSVGVDDLTTRSVDLRPERIKAIDDSGIFFIQNYTAITGDRFVSFVNIEEEEDPKLMIAPLEDNQFQFGETFFKVGEGVDCDSRGSSFRGGVHTTDNGESMLFRASGGIYLSFFDSSDPVTPPTMTKEYLAQVAEYDVQTFGSGEKTIIIQMHTPETMMGFTSVSADNDNFYLLYSDATYEEYNRRREDKEMYGAAKVLVFNRKGEPKEKLLIENHKYTAALIHSSIDNSLYSVDYDQDGNDCLVQYKL